MESEGADEAVLNIVQKNLQIGMDLWLLAYDSDSGAEHAQPQLNDVNPSNSDGSLSPYLMMLTQSIGMDLWFLENDSA